MFVAHSLGGLVCAEVMVMGARRASGDNASVIARYTQGMIFFGTPFRGSKGAQSAEIARKILSAFGVNTQEKTLKLLGVDSERLTGLNAAFQETIRKRYTSNKPEDKIEAMFFYETLHTYGGMVSRQIHGQTSAYFEYRLLNRNPRKFQVVATALQSVLIIWIYANSRHQMTKAMMLLLR